jgi:hypothetical protein
MDGDTCTHAGAVSVCGRRFLRCVQKRRRSTYEQIAKTENGIHFQGK